ncbi:calcium/sodium antiporter [Nocardiopsis ganjiahuensis]|uniref:calcium/sodium antiporter n=1 Tax=Nocardiopsis ganjiahuensis TaxID=239984 RepID=UPI0004772E76|nr:calcium/sodium antiporter [Nocardiopsis ganjiahuensis]
MSGLTALGLILGFVLLIVGGESLVRGASSLARTLGMSPLVVGLTVVSFTTSAPELAVSVGAVFDGYPGLAVGNVVGSNIANILFVLGAAALAAPLAVRSQVVRTDIPVMIVLSAGMFLLALDGTISRFDGVLLFAALLAYVTVTVVLSRRRAFAVTAPLPGTGDVAPGPERGSGARALRALADLGLVVLGAALLVAGARLLVDAASQIAAQLGVSDLVIGLTVVAVGTSLPELVTCVVAVVRGQRDLALGNVVGSNVFNIGAVLGLSAVVAPEGIEVAASALRFDIPIMFAVALILLPIAFTHLAVARWEGALLLVFYCAYIGYLLLEAGGYGALDLYGAVMLWFVVPVTVVWLVLTAMSELGPERGRRGRRP